MIIRRIAAKLTQGVFLITEQTDFHPQHGRTRVAGYLAQSWKRLILEGKAIREQEYMLLKHKYLEAILESKGMTHEMVHSIAHTKHNYAKYLK